MRQVFDRESYQVIVTRAFDFQPRGNTLARHDSDFERFVRHRPLNKIRGGLFIRFKGDEQLWFFAQLDLAEIVCGF